MSHNSLFCKSWNKVLIFTYNFFSTADEEFDELCFKFGLEIDDVVDEADTGAAFKIEVGANRYDLLCIEGIARSLRIYLGLEEPPRYKLSPAKEPEKYKLIVKPAVAQVKAVCICFLIYLIILFFLLVENIEFIKWNLE